MPATSGKSGAGVVVEGNEEVRVDICSSIHCILSLFLGLIHLHRLTQTCTSNISRVVDTLWPLSLHLGQWDKRPFIQRRPPGYSIICALLHGNLVWFELLTKGKEDSMFSQLSLDSLQVHKNLNYCSINS